MSWPVEKTSVPDAMRWKVRDLELVRRGVLAPADVIDRRAHRAQLWLHADPFLRRHLCREVLRPLLTETPRSREILAETLVGWLESRGSNREPARRAPTDGALPAQAPPGVVGDDLREAEFLVQAMMLLKASIPLWKAGDRSDFDVGT